MTLLPTPVVNDMGEGKTVDHWDEWTAKMQAKHGNGNGHGKSLAIEALRLLPTSHATRGGSHTETVELLPTPMTAYSGRTAEKWLAERPAGNGATRSKISDLEVLVRHLLPTPTASEGNGIGAHGTGSADLRTTIATTDFGTYAPAIERWEHVIGRPAPAPTEPGTTRPRLSAAFCEWMMGLPEGWVTDTPGISRNEALKALGNGVVPQQGAVAIRHLLDLMEGQDQ